MLIIFLAYQSVVNMVNLNYNSQKSAVNNIASIFRNAQSFHIFFPIKMATYEKNVLQDFTVFSKLSQFFGLNEAAI